MIQDPEKQSKYLDLQEENQAFLITISDYQKELDAINLNAEKIQQQLSHDPLKQKAVILHQKLTEVREKKKNLETSIRNAENESGFDLQISITSKQVKEDNLETSGMERKISEIQDKIYTIKEQIAQAEADLDPNQSIFFILLKVI